MPRGMQDALRTGLLGLGLGLAVFLGADLVFALVLLAVWVLVADGSS